MTMVTTLREVSCKAIHHPRSAFFADKKLKDHIVQSALNKNIQFTSQLLTASIDWYREGTQRYYNSTYN
jgi:hypothetical protein